MKIRPLFKKHQRELIAFANTPEGRGMLGDKFENRIVKVTPDGIHEHLENDLYRATFYPRSPFINLFGKTLTYVDIAKASGYSDKHSIAHYLGIVKRELPTIYLAQDTFNPDASPESTSVDGLARRDGVDEDFSTIRGGAGNDSNDTNAANAILLESTSTSNQYAEMRRTFYLFDTSSLPDQAEITKAIFSVFGTGKANGLGSPDFHVAASNPASNTAIANGDYGNVSRTSFGSVSYASFSTSSYNDITLNSSGVSNITKTGVSKFSGQLSWDINDNFTGTWSSLSNSFLNSNQADNGSNEPKLVVEFVSGIMDLTSKHW